MLFLFAVVFCAEDEIHLHKDSLAPKTRSLRGCIPGIVGEAHYEHFFHMTAAIVAIVLKFDNLQSWTGPGHLFELTHFCYNVWPVWKLLNRGEVRDKEGDKQIFFIGAPIEGKRSPVIQKGRMEASRKHWR